jgi:hypothetical protein
MHAAMTTTQALSSRWKIVIVHYSFVSTTSPETGIDTSFGRWGCSGAAVDRQGRRFGLDDGLLLTSVDPVLRPAFRRTFLP